jgi:hypothetical protein
MPICPYVIVIELHKMRLFIYIPYAMDQIWTFNLVYIYADWSFCYLTYNVFFFYGLSYSMTSTTYTSQGAVYAYGGSTVAWVLEAL